MDFPKRKAMRLTEFDYSRGGAYFITICTQNRKEIFGEIYDVGACIARPPEVRLSFCGTVVQEAILRIPMQYPALAVDKYVVMPNHIHLILLQNPTKHGSAMRSPTVSTVIGQLKGYVTKKLGRSVWQKSFYDHVIRNEQEYLRVWQYIDDNPANWAEDEYYTAL